MHDTPTVPAQLQACARRLLAARPELAAEFGGIDTPRAWRWLLEHAWPHDAELQAILPVPPAALIARTAGGHADAMEFHRGGLIDLSHVYERFVLAGAPFPSGKVLDFGCGAGRLLRHLAPFAAHCAVHGADVDVEAIGWARERLQWAEFATLAMQPPSPYPAAHFDAAFAHAVLSQLAPPLQAVWLAELARILRPGALLFVSVHGRRCAARFADGAVGAHPFPPADLMRADLPAFERDGERFYPYPAALDVGLPVNARGRGLHGVAFVTPAHVSGQWLEHFELVEHVEAARGFLDEILLRRRRDGTQPGEGSGP